MVVKRSTDGDMKALIFDIEGTTTSISFVKETLFPYVRENLIEFVQRQWNEPEFQDDLKLLKEQCARDAGCELKGFVPIPDVGSDAECQEATVNNVLWQMSLDAKNTALKQLQGHIMREGYKKGQLKGHVYEDVVPSLKKLHQKGLKLYIYSSGSVEAQKLLFGHTTEGNLLELFSGHFDTDIGAKTESSSYAKIVKQIEFQPQDVVFFTDMPKEAYAARDAGLTAVLVSRDGNATLDLPDMTHFSVIRSFEDFEWEVPAKRRKVSTDDLPVEDIPTTGCSAESAASSPDEVKETIVSIAKKTEPETPDQLGTISKESVAKLEADVVEGKISSNLISNQSGPVETESSDGNVLIPAAEPKENVADSSNNGEGKQCDNAKLDAVEGELGSVAVNNVEMAEESVVPKPGDGVTEGSIEMKEDGVVEPRTVDEVVDGNVEMKEVEPKPENGVENGSIERKEGSVEEPKMVDEVVDDNVEVKDDSVVEPKPVAESKTAVEPKTDMEPKTVDEVADGNVEMKEGCVVEPKTSESDIDGVPVDTCATKEEKAVEPTNYASADGNELVELDNKNVMENGDKKEVKNGDSLIDEGHGDGENKSGSEVPCVEENIATKIGGEGSGDKNESQIVKDNIVTNNDANVEIKIKKAEEIAATDKDCKGDVDVECGQGDGKKQGGVDEAKGGD